MKVTVIDKQGRRVEHEKAVADVLVLRYGFRSLIVKSDEELAFEKAEQAKKDELESNRIKKILNKLGVDFHKQLGLTKLQALLEETLED